MRLLGINKIIDNFPRVGKSIFQVVMVLALIYFAYVFADQWAIISLWRPNLFSLGTTLLLMLIYSATLFLLAENWHWLLRKIANSDIRRDISFPSFTYSQIAKYLPGNIFHFVGRYIWLTQKGLAHRALFKATAFEILTLVFGAMSIVALLILIAPLPGDSDLIGILNLIGPWFVFLAAASIFVYLILLFISGSSMLNVRSDLGFSYIFFGPALFFAAQGAIFFLICQIVTPTPSLALAAAATTSWLVGFVTLGSPGGIGTREVILLVLLRPLMNEADAVLAITLFRLVTTFGDLFCFLIGRLIWSQTSD